MPIELGNHSVTILFVDLTGENIIPLVDLSAEENTNPVIYDNIGNDSDVEILSNESPASLNPHSENLLRLEPLDPDLKYRQNITHIFFNLDEYARSVFSNNHSN